MNRIGFPKSRMKEEERIALIPEHITRFIKNPSYVYIETGYGERCGFTDKDYLERKANVVSEREASSLEVICLPKFCKDDLPRIQHNQTVFGWLHLERDAEDTKQLIDKGVTAIPWEFLYKKGKYILKENRELTGRLGVLHSIVYGGKKPSEYKAAVIGKGMVGSGAIKQLEELGAKVAVYDWNTMGIFKRNIELYDVIVHCADARKTILNKEHLSKMQIGALFVHLGSDSIDGGFIAQSIYSPVVPINDGRNLAYRVNHVPTLAYKTLSRYISKQLSPYFNLLIKGEKDPTLENAIAIDGGRPIFERLWTPEI